MSETPATVFVTKYAMSEGIKERDLSHFWMGGRPVVIMPGGLNGEMLLRDGEYAFTREEAVTQANAMKAKKLASLRKQIARLEGMAFGE